MNYSGKLSDNTGQPLPDSSYSVTFKIYDDSIAGTVVWAETRSIATTNGLISVQLGESLPLTDAAFSSDSRWLGVQVESDPELVPRTRLSTTPYSHRVSTVDGTRGGSIVGDVEVNGEISVIGPGVRFPDGTLQSSAASEFDPFVGILNSYTEFTSGAGGPQTTTAFTAPPDSSVFITAVTSLQQCQTLLELQVDGNTLVRIGGPGNSGQQCTYEWHSYGGAPLVVSAGKSLQLAKIGNSSFSSRVTIVGYKR